MADSLREEILVHFCRQQAQLRIIVGMLITFLLLSIGATQAIPSDSAAYVINTMNIVGLSVFLLAFGSVTVYCHRSETMRYR